MLRSCDPRLTPWLSVVSVDGFDVISHRWRRCFEAQGRNKCLVRSHVSKSMALKDGKDEQFAMLGQKKKYMNDRYAEKSGNVLNCKCTVDAALQTYLCSVTNLIHHSARHLRFEVRGKSEMMPKKAAERDHL